MTQIFVSFTRRHHSLSSSAATANGICFPIGHCLAFKTIDSRISPIFERIEQPIEVKVIIQSNLIYFFYREYICTFLCYNIS